MKRTVLALILGALPASTAVAGEVDVGIEFRTANARVAVAATNGDSVWVPGRWENHGGEWVWIEGHWRRAGAPTPAPVYHTAQPVEVVYTEVAPPAPIVEAQPVAPYAHAVWIPGHWRWHHRRYVWIGGRWDTPRPGYVYEAPRWSRHGGRWACSPGGWRRHHAYHQEARYDGDDDDDDRHGRGRGNGHWKHRKHHGHHGHHGHHRRHR